MEKKGNLKYSKNNKYTLLEEFVYWTDIMGATLDTEFISLAKDGELTIKEFYSWDGASGAVDSKNFIVPSLVHDALYQLLRLKLLPKEYRKKADRLLLAMLEENGMSRFRRGYVYRAVRLFGGKAI